MVNFQRKERYDWEDLLTIMRILRAPGGCPWDREQTHSSIRRNFLEETYEVLDAIDHDDAERMAKKMQESGFDMEDLLENMEQIHKMGSMRSIIKLIPGASQVTDEQVEQGEVQLKKTKAMIQSMTKAERAKPSLIDPKRKRRIAAGSGTQVSDVNQLLRQFDQMQKMMKQFGLGGKNLHGKKARMNRAGMLKLMGGMPKK